MSVRNINIDLGERLGATRPRRRGSFKKYFILFILALVIGAGGSRFFFKKLYDKRISKINSELLENQKELEVKDSIVADLENQRLVTKEKYEFKVDSLQKNLTFEKSRQIIKTIYVPSKDKDIPKIVIDEKQAEAIVLDRKELEFLRTDITTCNDLVAELKNSIVLKDTQIELLESKSKKQERQIARLSKKKKETKGFWFVAGGLVTCIAIPNCLD